MNRRDFILFCAENFPEMTHGERFDRYYNYTPDGSSVHHEGCFVDEFMEGFYQGFMASSSYRASSNKSVLIDDAEKVKGLSNSHEI